MNRLYTIIFLSSLLILNGCFELEEIFTLNPDGSGKVEVTAVFQGMDFSLNGSDDNDPQGKLISAVTALLEQSKGIDTWKNVTYNIKEDGRIFFQATAYFKDINKVELHNLGVIDVAFNSNKQGQLVLVLGDTKEDKTNDPAEPDALNKEQLQKQITNAKMEYQQSINMARLMLADMKEKMIFHLPAKVIKATGSYQTEPDGAVSFAISGAVLLKEMDAIMQDDKRLAEIIKSGDDPMEDAPITPVKILLEPSSQPLFNYQKELAKAQADYQRTQKKLGMIPTIAPSDEKMSGAVTLTNVRIGGVRLITESDQDEGIRPFNYDQGYTLSVVADLTGSITQVREACITKATTDTGTDLLPENEWDRKIHFTTLTENKKHIVFDVNLNVPDKKVKGLKEVSGHLDCLIANSTEKVNLGFEKLAEGAKGKLHQAKITKLTKEKNWSDELVHVLEFQLKLSRYMIKNVMFQSADGSEIETKSGSTMYGDNSTTFEYNRKIPFPPDTRIVIEVYQNAQKQKVPFKLENLNLLGQPKK